MNNEITPEQEKQIAELIEQAVAQELLEQATNPSLSDDMQQRFAQDMLRRMDNLYAQATAEQGIRHLAPSKDPDELRKTLSERFCDTFCDEQGQLHEKYHQMLELGGDRHRELLKDVLYVFVTFLIPMYPNTAYLMSLYMVLYIFRIRMDKWCAKRCQKQVVNQNSSE